MALHRLGLEHHELGVELAAGQQHVARGRFGAGGGAGDEGHGRRVVLAEGQVNERPGRLGDGADLGVAGNADDGQVGVIVARSTQDAPDGRSPRPEALLERFADDGHRHRILAVAIVEITAAQDLDAGGLEELGIDGGAVTAVAVAPGRRLDAIDVEGDEYRVGQRQVQVVDEADRIDPGKLHEPFTQAANELLSLVGVVARARQHDGQNAGRFVAETGVYRLGRPGASHEQSRGYQQDQAKGNLRHHERVAQRHPTWPVRPRATCLECRRHVTPAAVPRRSNAEKQPRDHRNRQAERQHGGVGCDVDGQRNGQRQVDGEKHSQQPHRHTDPADSTQESQAEGLGE